MAAASEEGRVVTQRHEATTPGTAATPMRRWWRGVGPGRLWERSPEGHRLPAENWKPGPTPPDGPGGPYAAPAEKHCQLFGGPGGTEDHPGPAHLQPWGGAGRPGQPAARAKLAEALRAGLRAFDRKLAGYTALRGHFDGGWKPGLPARCGWCGGKTMHAPSWQGCTPAAKGQDIARRHHERRRGWPAGCSGPLCARYHPAGD